MSAGEESKAKECKIGEAVVLSAFIAGATVMEINGKPADGLWLFIVVWAFFF